MIHELFSVSCRNFIVFLGAEVCILSKVDQIFTLKNLSFIKVWSNFDFSKSEFHQSLIKLWFFKVWVSSKFDKSQTFKVWVSSKFDFSKSEFYQSLTFESLSFVKVCLFYQSFIKVWLWKSEFSSNFDKTVKLWQKSDFQKSNFDETQTLKSQTLTKLRLSKSDFHQSLIKLRLSKVKVWPNFDETQTLKNQSLIKLWWKSDFIQNTFE